MAGLTRRTGRVMVLALAAGLLAVGVGCEGAGRGLEARKGYENPGGMWMGHQMADQVEVLRELGVDRPERWADLAGDELGAIVWLGGCSASFVSEEGLILTNHHCAQDSLAYYSTPERNIAEEGFLARRRAEELGGEPGNWAWVTRRIVDVTERVRAGLGEIEDPLERYKELERRVKEIEGQCEAGGAQVRCECRRFYERAKYYLIEMEEIRDVRLVYAPARGIGFFGGDVDNWHWPRHTGDFAMYRAYVGPDGRGADYAEENVPYRPADYLEVAWEGVEKHDLVVVAGYPGRTQRWQTAEEVWFDYEVRHPWQIEQLREVAGIYRELGQRGEALKIKTDPRLFGTTNHLQFLELVQASIERAGLLGEKESQEAALLAWIGGDEGRRWRWGGVLGDIEAVNEEYRQGWRAVSLLWEMVSHVEMVDAAHTIVRMAEERPKPDEEREMGFQERDWDELGEKMRRMERTYDAAIDKAVLACGLRRLCELGGEGEAVLRAVAPELVGNCAGVDERVERLWSEAVELEDTARRLELLEGATLAELEGSEDPLVQLALRLRPLTKAEQEKGKRYAGVMAMLRPEYVEALQVFSERPLAADANGTLRMTYGTVRGYESPVTGERYEAFTTLEGVVAKHTGEEPFDAPAELLAGAAAVGPGTPGWEAAMGGLPVNFLSDVDITGGNSGSATLNGRGELVGVVFDGNSESLASDWVYMPEITRAIHADIRYLRWVLEEVEGAEGLLREMGLKSQK